MASSLPSEPLDTIEGTVERIVFASPDGAYTVARLARDGERDLTTIVGRLVELKEGEVLRLDGRWSVHKKFGRQFEVERYEVATPRSPLGIQRYLASGLVHGIGPELAKRLVRKFGPQTLDVIEGQPERLRDVEGIGPKRAAQIVASYAGQKGLREVMVFLSQYGVSPTIAKRIHETYGGSAVTIVQGNPYRLASDIFRVGFRTADRIAQNMGIPADSPQRAAAGVIHALKELGNDGHACCPHDALVASAAEMLDLPPERARKAIEDQVAAGELVRDASLPDAPVYLPTLHAAEAGVSRSLARLAKAPRPFRKPIDADAALRWVQNRVRIELAEGQAEAVRAAVASKLTVITGGPGVGKTTVLRCLVEILAARHLRVALGAPTGRAAKRLSEATGAQAMTIHRLLKYQPRTDRFEHNERNPLEADAVIVDEASMLDLLLTYHLVRAIRPEALLVLVGDVDQLPSVGPGSVLRDIIGSGVATVVRLTQIFRQLATSTIVTNAHRINQGQMPRLRARGADDDRDFFFLTREDPEDAAQAIVDLCARRLPARYGLDPLDDIQVLSPMHKGAVGAQALNARLQDRLNPSHPDHTIGGQAYRVGDKVMQIRNNYDKDVFNGDIGRIAAVDPAAGQLVVHIDGRDVAYATPELRELVPAYAITIHKSQGCEYPCVVVPVLTQHYIMLQRNLLYTAITRGKRLVVLVGTTRAIAIAVRNDRIRERHAHLRDRLRAW